MHKKISLVKEISRPHSLLCSVAADSQVPSNLGRPFSKNPFGIAFQNIPRRSTYVGGPAGLARNTLGRPSSKAINLLKLEE